MTHQKVPKLLTSQNLIILQILGSQQIPPCEGLHATSSNTTVQSTFRFCPEWSPSSHVTSDSNEQGGRALSSSSLSLCVGLQSGCSLASWSLACWFPTAIVSSTPSSCNRPSFALLRRRTRSSLGTSIQRHRLKITMHSLHPAMMNGMSMMMSPSASTHRVSISMTE